MATDVRGTTTVRIPRTTHERLKAIASETGGQIGDIVARAVEEEERRLFMQRFNEGYARLKGNAEAWAAYKAEMSELEGTLGDGLDPDEDWSDFLAARPEEVEFLESGDAEAR